MPRVLRLLAWVTIVVAIAVALAFRVALWVFLRGRFT